MSNIVAERFIRTSEETIEMSDVHQDATEQTAPLIQHEDGNEYENESSSREDPSAGYNKVLIWFLTLSAGVSGLLFGYDTGVISSMLVSMGSDLSNRSLTTLDKSLITSCTSLFALIASPIAGSMADYLGRKKVIFIGDVLFILGALWQAMTSQVWGMIIGRSIVGLAIGGASLVIPLYISELAPPEMRGRLVTINVLFITAGQVVAYVVGWAFSTHQAGWRWIVGLGAIPAAIQLGALIFMSESPRWLVKAEQSDRARSVLSEIYGSSDGHNEAVVDNILRAIQQEHLDQGSSPGSKYSCSNSLEEFELLFTVGSHRRALAIACLLQGLQQLCGFNSVMYFSATLFQDMGFSSPTLTSLSVAITNFVFTLAAFHLIDRIGRRRMLLYSIPFMILALLLCAMSFVFVAMVKGIPPNISAIGLLISLVIYVAAYALGLGNVPWQQSELFPLSVRSTGSAIATSVNWSSNFIVGLTFLPMMEFLFPGLAFVCYALVCLGGLICIWAIYPETKGLGLEEVSTLLQNGWGVQESLAIQNRPSSRLER